MLYKGGKGIYNTFFTTFLIIIMLPLIKWDVHD